MLPEHAFAALTTQGIVSNSCVFYRQMLPLQLVKANGDSHLVRVLPTIHNEPLRRINVLPWPACIEKYVCCALVFVASSSFLSIAMYR